LENDQLEDRGVRRIIVRRILRKCVWRVESVLKWLIINISSGVRASDLLPWS
jgi:hypothetical protein